MLFRGRNFGCKITRTFTNSHFDHVAMILKFDVDKNEVFFLESTSDRGVSITRWSGIKRFIGNFYEQVVYR